jgi:tRNA-(ms[2]io[6]A)-hydroxylase
MTMLNLAEPTREGWLPEVAGALEELLLDHAHCEKKAASAAINMLFRYPDKAPLLQPLSELAREELEHFELLLRVLAERGIEFRRVEPSPYGAALHKAVRSQEPARLLDTLLCCGLIEARSCERMQILAEGLEDPELRELYGSLLASEARHHGLYLELANTFFPRDEVKVRLAELAAHEAAVLATPGPQPRMHS